MTDTIDPTPLSGQTIGKRMTDAPDPFTPLPALTFGQRVELTGKTPDGRSAAVVCSPTLWNQGDPELYDALRNAVLKDLNPEHGQVITWNVSVMNSPASGPSGRA